VGGAVLLLRTVRPAGAASPVVRGVVRMAAGRAYGRTPASGNIRTALALRTIMVRREGAGPVLVLSAGLALGRDCGHALAAVERPAAGRSWRCTAGTAPTRGV
jgi:hypothetical protein